MGGQGQLCTAQFAVALQMSCLDELDKNIVTGGGVVAQEVSGHMGRHCQFDNRVRCTVARIVRGV